MLIIFESWFTRSQGDNIADMGNSWDLPDDVFTEGETKPARPSKKSSKKRPATEVCQIPMNRSYQTENRFIEEQAFISYRSLAVLTIYRKPNLLPRDNKLRWQQQDDSVRDLSLLVLFVSQLTVI